MNLIGICAIDKNGLLGNNGKLPWHYPEDFKFFRKQTLDSTIIMGGKSWRSLPKKPLDKRNNIILTRNPPLEIYPNTYFVDSSEKLSEKLFSLREPHYVIGGLEIFNLLWDRLQFFYISHINTEVRANEGDEIIYFPLEKLLGEFEVINEIPLSNDCKVKKYKRL